MHLPFLIIIKKPEIQHQSWVGRGRNQEPALDHVLHDYTRSIVAPGLAQLGLQLSDPLLHRQPLDFSLSLRCIEAFVE